MIQHNNNKLDIYGMAASIICAVHCAAIPVFLTFGSAYMAEVLHHPIFEVGFLLIAIVIAVWSLGKSYLYHHHNKKPLVLGIIGVAFVTLGVIVHAWQITLPGGLVLAYAHFWNFKLLKSCACGISRA